MILRSAGGYYTIMFSIFKILRVSLDLPGAKTDRLNSRRMCCKRDLIDSLQSKREPETRRSN